MAKEQFIPTENDKKFLEAFLNKNQKDKPGVVCKKVGLPPNWYGRRVNSSSEFSEWFTRETIKRQGPKIAEIINIAYKAIESKRENPNPQLVKILLDKLSPSMLEKLMGGGEEEDKSPEEIRREIVSMIDEEAKSVCSHCGAPLVDWDSWRFGGEPENEEVEEAQTDH